MSEGQAETTTQTATEPNNPAPATAVAEKPAGAATAATTEAKPQAQTETKTVTDTKEVARQMFKQREQKREQKASERLAQLEKEFESQKAELEKYRASPKPAEAAAPNLIEDPEGYAKWVREQAKQDAYESLKQEFEATEAKTRHEQSALQAGEWLLTRSHLKQDQALIKDVAGIIEQKYAHIANVDPRAAAELAYLQLCKAKGIAPDMDFTPAATMDATKGQASMGARPTAAPAGERVWTHSEAEKYVMSVKPGTKEYRSRLAEIAEAKAKGRIR